jgi:hypothetical protein
MTSTRWRDVKQGDVVESSTGPMVVDEYQMIGDVVFARMLNWPFILNADEPVEVTS